MGGLAVGLAVRLTVVGLGVGKHAVGLANKWLGRKLGGHLGGPLDGQLGRLSLASQQFGWLFWQLSNQGVGWLGSLKVWGLDGMPVYLQHFMCVKPPNPLCIYPQFMCNYKDLHIHQHTLLVCVHLHTIDM